LAVDDSELFGKTLLRQIAAEVLMFQSTSFSPVDLIFEAAGDRFPGQQRAQSIAVMPGDLAADVEKHASTPRLRRKIEEALGVGICQALHARDVTEIMLNPDGKLFVERSGKGLSILGQMSRASAEVTIGAVAHALGVEIDAQRPIVSGQLPIGGHRFEGLLPPIVAAPTFSIRRRSRHHVKQHISAAPSISASTSSFQAARDLARRRLPRQSWPKSLTGTRLIGSFFWKTHQRSNALLPIWCRCKPVTSLTCGSS
jgi:type IV secretion system protein VirB11